MELWIRSQDKTTIIKCNELYIEEIDSFLIRERNSTHILGAYETIERALEILDEIQNILQPTVIYKEPKIDYNDDNFIQQMSQNILVHSTQQVEMELKQAGQIVYEMPIE